MSLAREYDDLDAALAGPEVDAIERRRLLRKIDSTTGCWIWTGSTDHNGYGQVRRNTVLRLAHRWVYELFVGPVPEGLDLDHLCRVRACCRPDHLEPVTRRVNILRGDIPRLNRLRAVNRTHCKNGHEFTEENTHVNAEGHRVCRACNRAAYHAAKRRAS